MSKFCLITGKKSIVGNNVSHSNNKSKRKFFPNLQIHRFWSINKKRYLKIKVSVKGMRIIDKKGIDNFIS